MKNLFYGALKKKNEQQHSPSERNFLMCKSCFWCASSLNIRDRSLNSCPSCTRVHFKSVNTMK